MIRLVIDTNIWISILLRGQATLPILQAWKEKQFQLVTSHALLDEYNQVWQRPRFSEKINPTEANSLYRQMRSRAEIVDLKTPPPRCRDPKDDPVLATAIDGQANVIVSGDNDLHADAELYRLMMDEYDIKIWRVHTLLIALENNE